MTTPDPGPHYETAQWLTEAHDLWIRPLWPVDPETFLCTCPKPDCSNKRDPYKSGKHPKWTKERLSVTDASYWEHNPDDPVGIDREASMIVMIEDDGEEDEWAAANDIYRPASLEWISPAGNYRTVYRLPWGFASQGNHVNPDGFKVDVLCLGVAPAPGVSNLGGEYREPRDCPIAPAHPSLVAWLESRFTARPEPGKAAEREPFVVLPDQVRHVIFNDGGGDRSKSGQTYAVVRACFDAGLSQGQAASVIDYYVPEAKAKYGRRLDTEIARIWDKAETEAGPEPAWLAEGRAPSPGELLKAAKRDVALAMNRGLIDMDQLTQAMTAPNGHAQPWPVNGQEIPVTIPALPEGETFDGIYEQWLFDERLGPDYAHLRPYLEQRRDAERAARDVQQPQAPPSRLDKLRAGLLDWDELSKVPLPEPVIAGWLYKNTLAWLKGEPGGGKTLAAVDMAGCVTTGRAWHYHEVARGPVLYLVLEGVQSIRQRAEAWMTHNKTRPQGKTFSPVRVNLMDPEDACAVAQLAHDMNPRPVLIVIDTQARATPGAEENSSRDMGVFVNHLERIREACGACVLVVHHEPRSGVNLRGSTALEGAASTIIDATRDGLTVTLRTDAKHGGRQKDAPERGAFELTMVPAGPGMALDLRVSAEALNAVSEAGQVILDTLKRYGELSVPQIHEMSEVSRSTAQRELRKLEDLGRVTTRQSGRSILWKLPDPVGGIGPDDLGLIGPGKADGPDGPASAQIEADE